MGTLQQSFKELSLSERLRRKVQSPALLIDVSGSTNRDIEPGQTELQAIRSIVASLPACTRIAFNSNAYKIDEHNPLPAKGSGGTILSKALDLAKRLGHKKVVIITDGEVDSYDQTPSMSSALGLEIKILFVGPGEKPWFLNKLAENNRGFCTKEELLEPKLLSEKLILLLEAGDKGGSIQL